MKSKRKTKCAQQYTAIKTHIKTPYPTVKIQTKISLKYVNIQFAMTCHTPVAYN